MKSTRKMPETKARTKKSTKDDLASSSKNEEKLKRNVYSLSTPRNYVPKSSTADIYARKKSAVTPRKMASVVQESPMKDLLKSTPSVSQKIASVGQSKESPMKDLLKSTPSTSQINKSSRQKMADLKKNPNPQTASRNPPKRMTSTNVIVNSPVAKRRLNLEVSKNHLLKDGTDKKETNLNKASPKESLPGRQRTKTRTLEDNEVKILTPDAIYNNAAMKELSRKLAAKPKAFYVDLEEKSKELKVDAVKLNSKSSEDEEVSYEDDFESYESDFESYRSEARGEDTSALSDGTSGEDDDQEDKEDNDDDDKVAHEEVDSKDVKNEEKMLDSGNFDLRDAQRSASRKPAVMDFILEGSEVAGDDKKASLPDEGFQEMSSSSAVSSMKIVHSDVLERPLFIDFAKCKENKRKRKILEKLRQRAKDILSMVTLHEMSYSLFEMKPIPYDLYMATFGRKNYTQTTVQTFEDGISQGVQTDDMSFECKWTQFPVKFTTNDIIVTETIVKKNSELDETLSKFDYLINQEIDDVNITVSEDYRCNPLKIFLEQKEGTGSDKMLPEEKYKAKLKNNDFNIKKLRKFLKKSESRISNILSLNTGNSDRFDIFKQTKLPFSKGYISISTKNVIDEKFNFLKCTKTTGVAISETKENFIMTYQKSLDNEITAKYFICLWDTSVVRSEPLKILKATNNVEIGRYRGNTNGIFVAALEDRTVHIWDLSEEPTWYADVASPDTDKPTEFVEINTRDLSQIEIDREWNSRNSKVGCDKKPQSMMQVSGYTTSAVGMSGREPVDTVVGLEFVGEGGKTREEGGKRIVGQICTLQRLGILTTWSIAQDKTASYDIGKAYWSKIKLEKIQTVHLTEHLHMPILSDTDYNFNLNAAKRRLQNRKQERMERRKDLSRPRSAILRNFDSPRSVANPRKSVPISSNFSVWDNGLVCNHMKVLRLDKLDNYLVATSNGDILLCRRILRDFKVERLCVACDKSPITRLEVNIYNLPYFLAATDSGTINLCSVLDARVLLTLDCRNGPPSTTERCRADHKGRFIASVPDQTHSEDDSASRFSSNMSVSHVWWSPLDPLCVAALCAGSLLAWQLAASDMRARAALACAANDMVASAGISMALLTTDGEVQVHRLVSEHEDRNSIELFKKYVMLL